MLLIQNTHGYVYGTTVMILLWIQFTCKEWCDRTILLLVYTSLHVKNGVSVLFSYVV